MREKKCKSDPAQKQKMHQANVFPNLGHAQDCDKSKKIPVHNHFYIENK